MLKRIPVKFFDGLMFVNPPVWYGFPEEWWKNDGIYASDDRWVEKIYPDVIGYCYNGDREPRYSVYCLDKTGFFGIYLNRRRFKTLKRWEQHMSEREQFGVSYRDAWNVDSWFADKTAKAIELLEKNTHSFPCCSIELHKKILMIDGFNPPYLVKSFELSEDEKKLTGDELACKWYHDDLKRIKFLLSEYNEETCSQKNEFKFDLDFKHEKITEGPHKGFYTMKFVGTPEQEAEAEKHRKRDIEIYQYRMDCLHKAIKMLDVYIEGLWD